MVSLELSKIKTNNKNDNCTPKQRQAIRELKKRKDVVIKPYDKGGNVVLWPVGMFEWEALRQLRDKTCYRNSCFIQPTDFNWNYGIFWMKQSRWL